MNLKMTDQIGDLDAGQIDHLARGLEHAHEMTLKAAGGGRYWLQSLDGGGVLMLSFRTVDYVWKCAEAISAEAEKM